MPEQHRIEEDLPSVPRQLCVLLIDVFVVLVVLPVLIFVVVGQGAPASSRSPTEGSARQRARGQAWSRS